jgi:tRNA U34 2-thiouridine synthase MnmA/TrmU
MIDRQAAQAGVPLEAVSMQKEYWAEVVAATIAEAEKGRTPNPDILCNSRIKFGMFYDQVGRHFQRVVTGHYARAVRGGGGGGSHISSSSSIISSASTSDGRHSHSHSHSHSHDNDNGNDDGDLVQLVRSPDRIKDQTYFLSALSQQQLGSALFPVGEYAKADVRAMAGPGRFDLPTQARKDSQGICFLGKLRWDDFLGHYVRLK